MITRFSRIDYTLVLLFVLAFALALTGPIPNAFAGPIPEAARKADARLDDKRVTTVASRIYVADLLKQWSEQTGVTLVADVRSGAASQPVCVFIRDVPLGDAMDALYSLLSYKEAAWDWTPRRRTESDNALFYEFSQSREARDFARRIQTEVQQSFEDELFRNARILQMPPDKRKEAVEKGDELVRVLQDERVTEGLQTFLQTFSPEKQRRLLRGEETVLMPVEQLPKAGKDFAAHQLKLMRESNPSLQIPEYTHIKFEKWYAPEKITPSLSAMLGTETEQGGGSIAGGTPLENKWRKNLTDQWILDDDERENAQASLSEPVKKPKIADASLPSTRKLELRLYEFAAGMPKISLMARVPLEQNAPPVPPHTFPSADAFLQRLGDYGVPHKWRNNVLLLTQSSWFQQEGIETLPTWAAISRLRDAMAKDPDGIPAIADLAFIAKESSDAQLDRLIEEFPVIAGVRLSREFFRLLGKSRTLREGIQSPDGVLLERVQSALPSSFRPSSTVTLPPRPRVRLTQGETIYLENSFSYRTVGVEFLSADGEWVRAPAGFFIRGRSPNQSGGSSVAVPAAFTGR